MGTKTETAVARKSARAPATTAPAAKTKSVKAPKTKKPSAPLKPRSHPPYVEMIQEAIVALKERTGSSQYAISKFIEDKQKENLSPSFKKLLLVQLKKLVASGKLTKVKNSFKLAVPVKAAATGEKKAPAVVTKKAPAKKVVAKPKAKKVVAKVKVGTPLKAKKVVAKPKAVEKKVKKVVAEKKAVKLKKSPAKGLKRPKSIKSPVKKPALKKAKK